MVGQLKEYVVDPTRVRPFTWAYEVTEA